MSHATKEALVARTFDIEHEGKMHQLVVLRDEVDDEEAIVCYARSQGEVSIKTAFKYGENGELRDEMFHGRTDDDWTKWGQRIIAQAESMTIYAAKDPAQAQPNPNEDASI